MYKQQMRLYKKTKNCCKQRGCLRAVLASKSFFKEDVFMESKIMRDLSRCNTSLSLMSLAFLNDFSEKEALEILKECAPKTKHLLKIIKNTPLEEIKKADAYPNEIGRTHTSIKNLDYLLFHKNFKVVSKSEVQKYAQEAYKNIQSIYCMLQQDFNLADKKNFLMEQIKSITLFGCGPTERIALYMGKELVRLKICTHEEAKIFIKFNEEKLIERITNLISAKDSANNFNYVTFMERVESNLMEDEPEWKAFKNTQ